RIEVQHTLGMEPEAVASHHGMPGIAATKILRRCVLDALDNALPQRRPHADVFARNAQRHDGASLERSAPSFPDSRVSLGMLDKRSIRESSPTVLLRKQQSVFGDAAEPMKECASLPGILRLCDVQYRCRRLATSRRWYRPRARRTRFHFR